MTPARPCRTRHSARDPACPVCHLWTERGWADAGGQSVPAKANALGLASPGPALRPPRSVGGRKSKRVTPPADLGVGPAFPTRPRVVATLAVGEVGRRMLQISGRSIRAYAERVGADYHVIDVGQSDYPLGEKFRAGTLLDSWERVLFLDADVIVSDNCPDLFSLVPEGSIGVHDDGPDVERLSGLDWLRHQYAAMALSQGWPIPSRFASCLNTGVVLFDRAHRDLWTPPPAPYPGFHTGEQNAVNWNLARTGYPVCRLDSTLNYQWWAHRDMKGPAHVWHYARPVGKTDAERLALMSVRAGVSPGPGTELKRMLTALGIVPPVGCQCERRAALMDEWGAEGCRRRRTEIVGWLTEEWQRLGWWERLKVGAAAVAKGAVSLDPVGAMVDESIRRAEG